LVSFGKYHAITDDSPHPGHLFKKQWISHVERSLCFEYVQGFYEGQS
jgi:hypothetical protein